MADVKTVGGGNGDDAKKYVLYISLSENNTGRRI